MASASTILRQTLSSVIPKGTFLQRSCLVTGSRGRQQRSPAAIAMISRRLPMHVCFSSTNNTCTDENTEKSDIKLASSSSSSSSSTKTMHESVSITVNPAPDLQIPGTQASSRKLAIVFTCTVCNTRSAKQFSESAYQNGVVIVQCPGCQNRHLIADRLGIFQDGEFDIDTIAATTGQSVTKISAGDMEFHLQDLLGYDKMREILQSTGVDIDVDDDADLSNSAGKDPKVS